jgi:PAS domain S-box-containing protein
MLERFASIVIDRQGRLVFTSQRFERLVGMDCSERLGKQGPHPWVPSEDTQSARELIGFFASGLAARRGVRIVELRLSRADGRVIRASAQCFPLPTREDPLFHAFIVRERSDARGEESLGAVPLLERARASMSDALYALEELAVEWGLSDSAEQRDLAQPTGLSCREREILAGLLLGQRCDEVAAHLSISRYTARNHMRAIFRKLGVHSHVELVSRYGQRGEAQK